MSKILSLFVIVLSLFVIVPAQSSKDQNRGFGGGSLASQRNEAAVIEEMKNFYAVQACFYRSQGFLFGFPFELRAAGLIDAELAAGEKHGYLFTFRREGASALRPSRFFINARPKTYRQSGVRSFYMDSRCIVTGEDLRGREASAENTAVDSCEPILAYEADDRAIQIMAHSAEAQFSYASSYGRFGNFDDLFYSGALIDPFRTNSMSLGRDWPVDLREQNRGNFKMRSTPNFYRETGMYSYFVDQSGILRGADRQGAPADEFDTPIDPRAQRSVKSNESMAFNLARWMWGTQRNYYAERRQYADFELLEQARRFSVPFETGHFKGYVYHLMITPGTGSGTAHYEFRATPEVYGVTGVLSFYTDESGFIRGGDKGGAAANADDPQVIYF